MSRGRKAKTTSIGLNWEQIFNKSQGFYFQYVITKLGNKNKILSEDNAKDLLRIIKREKEKLIAERKITKDKPLNEITLEEIPFEIPKNWVWCKLGKVATMIYGSGLTKAKTIPNAEFPVFGSNGIVGYFDEYLTDKRAIIIGRKGSSGALNISEKPSWTTDVAYYVEETENTDFTFLYFLLKSLNLDKLGKGIKPGLNRSEAYNLSIALPPLVEQKMISDFLQDFGRNAIDGNREYFDLEIENEIISIHQAQIYNNQISTELSHQLALVKELRQAYLREAMQGKLVAQDRRDEPAEILLKKIKAEKEKLIAEKKVKKDKTFLLIEQEEILLEIPNNWTWCRLGDISGVYGGKRLPYGHSFADDITPHIYIRITDMKFGTLIEDNLKYISENVFRLISQYVISSKDLYITIAGTIGQVGIVPEQFDGMNLTENAAKIVFNNAFINRIFLKYLLNSELIQPQFRDKTKAMAQPKLALKRIETTLIPLPPLAEQGRIVAKLEKLMKFCDELEANIKQGITNADQLLQTALKEALESR